MNLFCPDGLRRTVVATLLLVSPLLANAQSRTPGGFGSPLEGSYGQNRPVRVFVGGGLTTMSGGEFKAIHENGFHLDGGLLVKLGELPIRFRPQLTFSSFRYQRPRPNILNPQPPAPELSRTRLVTALGNIELSFGPGFYAMAGAGATNLNTNFAGDTLANAKATNLTMDAGSGVRFAFGRIQGYIEVRVASAAFDKEKIGFSRTQFIPMTFGLVF